MNDVHSTLVVHCGARKVTREELKEIPVPEGTRTHQPLSHFQIVEVLEEALSFRYLKVVRDEYAVSRDGMKLFGVMDLNTGFDGGSFSIGLRNSNDKSMRLALTAGYRVFVCDNMAFSGDFTPLLYKHTRNLELKDSITIAVDRIQRGFDTLGARVKEMREIGLTDNDARVLIYRAFLEKEIRGAPRNLMAEVHGNYFEPAEEGFMPRNLWSLSNAFTSAFKTLAPMKQFEVTARLGAYFSAVQEDLKRKPVSGTQQSTGSRVQPYDRTGTSGSERNGHAFIPFPIPVDQGDPVLSETSDETSADDRPFEAGTCLNGGVNSEMENVAGAEPQEDAIDVRMEEFGRKVAA